MKRVWYDHNADNPPWIEALADVRRLSRYNKAGIQKELPVSTFN
jgi:hypothetical protein